MITLQQLQSVYEIGKEYFNPLAVVLMAVLGTVYFVKRRRTIVGFAIRTGRYLHYLAIKNGYKGLGFGQALFQQVLPEVDALHVKDDNPAAIQLYQNNGFRIVRSGWWITGKRILMRKIGI